MNLTDLVTPEQLLLNATLCERHAQDNETKESIDRLVPFLYALENMRGIGFTATTELIGLLTLVDLCINQSTQEKN